VYKRQQVVVDLPDYEEYWNSATTEIYTE